MMHSTSFRLSAVAASFAVVLTAMAASVQPFQPLAPLPPVPIPTDNPQSPEKTALGKQLFWEGSVTSLEAQAASAAEGGVAGNGDPSVMEMRLRFIPEYVASFRKVFGSEWPRMNDAYHAISAYQRTVVTDATKVPFDRYANRADPVLFESAPDPAPSTTCRGRSPTSIRAASSSWSSRRATDDSSVSRRGRRKRAN